MGPETTDQSTTHILSHETALECITRPVSLEQGLPHAAMRPVTTNNVVGFELPHMSRRRAVVPDPPATSTSVHAEAESLRMLTTLWWKSSVTSSAYLSRQCRTLMRSNSLSGSMAIRSASSLAPERSMPVSTLRQQMVRAGRCSGPVHHLVSQPGETPSSPAPRTAWPASARPSGLTTPRPSRQCRGGPTRWEAAARPDRRSQ